MVILNGDLMRAEETTFWKFSSGKLFLNSQNTLKKMTTMESALSKVAPACLLKSLSVMGNLLVKFFKGLLKTVCSTRNTTLGLFLKFISDVHSSVAGVWLFSSYDCNKSSASQKFQRRIVCHQVDHFMYQSPTH